MLSLMNQLDEKLIILEHDTFLERNSAHEYVIEKRDEQKVATIVIRHSRHIIVNVQNSIFESFFLAFVHVTADDFCDYSVSLRNRKWFKRDAEIVRLNDTGSNSDRWVNGNMWISFVWIIFISVNC